MYDPNDCSAPVVEVAPDDAATVVARLRRIQADGLAELMVLVMPIADQDDEELALLKALAEE